MAKEKWDIKKASESEIRKLRRTLIIWGVILLFIFLPLSIVCFIFAHTCKKELKSRQIEEVKIPETVTPEVVTPVEEPEVVEETKEPEKPCYDRVKVTDIDGSVHDLSIYMSIAEDDKVLVAEGGKTYHKYASCFKNWKPEMIESFTGWKIIKKSDAIANNMKCCAFCENKDKSKELCNEIYKEYKNLLKGYKDANTEEKVYILSECYRKLNVIESKDYYDIDVYDEYEKIEKKARSFINAYIKEKRESGYDDYMIDITQFSHDLDFIWDYINEKDEKLNKM